MEFCFGIQLSFEQPAFRTQHLLYIHVFSHLYVTPKFPYVPAFFPNHVNKLKDKMPEVPEDFPCLEQIHITNSKLKVVGKTQLKMLKVCLVLLLAVFVV